MTHDEKLWTAKAMIREGGSFVRHIGEALLRADSHNEERLIGAFPDYMETYKARGAYLAAIDKVKDSPEYYEAAANAVADARLAGGTADDVDFNAVAAEILKRKADFAADFNAKVAERAAVVADSIAAGKGVPE